MRELQAALNVAFIVLASVVVAACDEDDDDTTMMAPCDPVAQDCGTDEKCSFVRSGAEFTTACVPVPYLDAGVVGQPCMRRSEAAFGYDTCAPGAFCTAIGVTPPLPPHDGDRYCRAMCDETHGCAAGERCAVQVRSPPRGFCGPTCEAFTGACDDGMTCADLYEDPSGSFFLACRPLGAAAVDAACTMPMDCGADQICFGPLGLPQRCRALCDAQHSCSDSEQQCFTSGTSSTGVCIPK